MELLKQEKAFIDFYGSLLDFTISTFVVGSDVESIKIIYEFLSQAVSTKHSDAQDVLAKKPRLAEAQLGATTSDATSSSITPALAPWNIFG